jgi:hypothetical protein
MGSHVLAMRDQLPSLLVAGAERSPRDEAARYSAVRACNPCKGDRGQHGHAVMLYLRVCSTGRYPCRAYSSRYAPTVVARTLFVGSLVVRCHMHETASMGAQSAYIP